MYSRRELVRLDARKCVISEVDKIEARDFLNNYHNQRYAYSSIRYGLYYNNELVQLMTFAAPRYNKSYQWEIIRECTKDNIIVRGGTSKLWRYFLDNNEVSSCICYSYPHNGEYTDHYCKYCGFKNTKIATPEQKTWFVGMWNGRYREISKSILERHGVDRLLKTKQGQDRTNEQIMLDLGFEKEVRDGLSPQVDIYFPNGSVYKISDDSGRYFIGCYTISFINGNIDMANRETFSVLDKSSIKYITLKDNFNTPDNMFKYALKTVRKLAYVRDGKIYKKVDDKCLNTGLEIGESAYCPVCGGRRGHHKNTCVYYVR